VAKLEHIRTGRTTKLIWFESAEPADFANCGTTEFGPTAAWPIQSLILKQAKPLIGGRYDMAGRKSGSGWIWQPHFTFMPP